MKKRKSGELRFGERNKGVEEKKIVRNMEMDIGLCLVELENWVY